ncbi:hypothetical protein SEUCBS139899_004315 [Sporothrix eucalyptigena]
MTPVQSPSQVSPIQGPPPAELSPNTPSQAPARRFYEIGGTPRYAEMAETQQLQQRAEMQAAPVQRHVSEETDQRRVEMPATPQQQHATEAAIVSQPLEAADDPDWPADRATAICYARTDVAVVVY